jgi:hypothetical protein
MPRALALAGALVAGPALAGTEVVRQSGLGNTVTVSQLDGFGFVAHVLQPGADNIARVYPGPDCPKTEISSDTPARLDAAPPPRSRLPAQFLSHLVPPPRYGLVPVRTTRRPMRWHSRPERAVRNAPRDPPIPAAHAQPRGPRVPLHLDRSDGQRSLTNRVSKPLSEANTQRTSNRRSGLSKAAVTRKTPPMLSPVT